MTQAREDFEVEYGRWLREVREAHGVSRRIVSVALDVDQASVGNWENAKTLPDVLTHVKIRYFFRATLDARPDLDARPRVEE